MASAPGSAHLHPEEAAKAATDNIHRMRVKPNIVCVCVLSSYLFDDIEDLLMLKLQMHHYKSEVTHILAWLKMLN